MVNKNKVSSSKQFLVYMINVDISHTAGVPIVEEDKIDTSLQLPYLKYWYGNNEEVSYALCVDKDMNNSSSSKDLLEKINTFFPEDKPVKAVVV